MFVSTLAVLHVIRPSRGKAVVRALFDAIRPVVWVSDMLGDTAQGSACVSRWNGRGGSQRGHGVLWQVCLAHLLRDAQYAIDCGDTAFSTPFRRLLLRAIAIGRRREGLKETTLQQYSMILIVGWTGSLPQFRSESQDASCVSACSPTAHIYSYW